jgi:hypothetical protein
MINYVNNYKCAVLPNEGCEKRRILKPGNILKGELVFVVLEIMSVKIIRFLSWCEIYLKKYVSLR